MLKIAYGEASFDNLRNRGDLYIDKTSFIPLLENHTKFFFIRPRRFGKSLWISVLHAYYDTNKTNIFDKLFGGLYIQKNPTNYKNSYLVLRFDFSGLNTENEFSLKNDFTFRVRRQVISFFRYYKNYFSNSFLENIEKQFENLSTSQLISRVKEEANLIQKKVYVLIDEYDHYANKLASEGRESFVKNIVSKTGFVREFYEQMKIASGEGVFERFFITGVSPIMLDELASGFNILSDMTTDSRFNEMIGFTIEEVQWLLDMVSEERYTQKTKEEVLKDLIYYYNGYCFSNGAKTRLFNSDMVLYFMEKFSGIGYPSDLLDENVKTDYVKLRGLIVGASGKAKLQSIIEEVNLNDTLIVSLTKRFNFTQRFGDNELKSLLFYLGLLTFSNKSERFKIPNQIIQTLYWEYLRKFLEESLTIEFDMRLLSKALYEMAEVGKVDSLKELAVDFFQEKLSGYDFSGLTEKHVKFIFVSYFTLSKLYNIISERELPGKKRIDLLFEAHPAFYEYVLYNFVVEFKYIRKKDTEEEANQKRKDAINQAREYYEIYKRDFKQFGRELRSLALIVSHSREVELIEVCGFDVF
ncbi:MAG: AAA family ATPase [Leptospiraceae bacterium]|nr:AAA family ATPase [Leptospiraceae bacterium]